jgi:hypothetical protein
MIMVSRSGNGRATLLLTEGVHCAYAEEGLYAHLQDEGQVVLLETGALSDYSHYQRSAAELTKVLNEKSIKFCTLVSFGRAAAVALLSAVNDHRLFRALAFVQPKVNFRSRGSAFDCRSYLHRIQSPSFVIIRKNEGDKISADVLYRLLPNAWLYDVGEGEFEVRDCLRKLALVPSRASQKRNRLT